MSEIISTNFAGITSTNDFVRAYQIRYPEQNMGRNDLVRAIRILAAYQTTGNHNFSFRYIDLNISQSSEPVFRSKIGKIYYTLGLTSRRRSAVRLLNQDLVSCVISLEAIRIQSPVVQDFIRSCNVESAAFSGRSQDRTTARHERGHRSNRRTRRLEALGLPVRSWNDPDDFVEANLNLGGYARLAGGGVDFVMAAARSAARQAIEATLDLGDFNPFAGVPADVFITLTAEAR